MNFEHKTLANGLTIVGEINKIAQSAAVGFFVRTGSRDETPEISGVSHFLEHMIFKGTDKLSPLEVNELFDKTGAKFNAFTSEENTVYYAAILPEYLSQITSLWSQLMRPSLREEDFNIEKNVIKEEIAMYKDLPHYDVMDRARSLHFAGHPCGNSVLGTDQTIDALTAIQMRNYFASRYAPNNMVVACTGNFEFDALVSQVESFCGDWESQPVGRATEFFMGTKQTSRIEKPNLISEHLCLVSPAVSFQDKRRFAASLLSMIVGDDSGSRFFWELVDNALCESATMQYEAMDGVGAMYSYLRFNPDNTDKIFETVGRIFAVLEETGVTADELQKAKNKVLSGLVLKNELPMGRLTDVGFNWVYLKQYKTINEEIDSIKAVTVEQVNQLIAEFTPSKFSQLALGPVTKTQS